MHFQTSSLKCKRTYHVSCSERQLWHAGCSAARHGITGDCTSDRWRPVSSGSALRCPQEKGWLPSCTAMHNSSMHNLLFCISSHAVAVASCLLQQVPRWVWGDCTVEGCRTCTVMQCYAHGCVYVGDCTMAGCRTCTVMQCYARGCVYVGDCTMAGCRACPVMQCDAHGCLSACLQVTATETPWHRLSRPNSSL